MADGLTTTSEPIYKPSDEKSARLLSIFRDLDECIVLRNKPWHYFGDQGLEDYINESQKRSISYIPPRAPGDWRTSVFMPETENAKKAILSFVASQRMRVELSARNDEKASDKQLSDIVSGLYEYSLDSENGDLKFFNANLENVDKGTVVVLEAHNYETRIIRQIISDPGEGDDIKYKEKEIVEEDNCYQQVIPLEDVFIPNFYEPNIQKQPYIIVREQIPYSIAKQRYAKKYKEFKYVKKKGGFHADKEGKLYFYEEWKERVEDGMVEVLHRWNKNEDQYDIEINGVLLTPLINPFIFDHKQYPFVKTIFEPFSADFFYGKSLPFKMMAEQDVLNTLYNMLLDRTYLSVMPFFFTSITDEIEEDAIGPMQRIQVSDVTQIREASPEAIQSGDIQMVTMVKESLSKSSVDPSQQGQTSNDTATAVLQARESAIRLLGLLINFMSWMIYDQAKLRIANILQFYPKSTKQKNEMGEFEVTEKEYRTKKQLLSNGKMGIRIIRMVDSSDLLPTEAQVQKMAEASDEEVEIFYITPNRLKNIDYTIRIIPNSNVPETKSLKKALGLEYVGFKLENFPDTSNREKLSHMIDELFDQNPEEMNIQPQQNPMMMQGMPQGNAQVPQIASQLLGNPQQSLNQMVGTPQ